MSLSNVLPPPRHSYTTINNNNGHKQISNEEQLQLEIVKLNSVIPPYGSRDGYIPREPEDFGDGGAFPEIPIKQYPLDMGRKDLQNKSSVVSLKVNDKGEVQYDAILRENMRKEQILHSKYTDLIPKDDIAQDDLLKPTEDIMMEETEETRKALEKLTNQQIESVRPTHTNLKQSKPITVRYQSGSQSQNSAHASGATSRLIKIYEMPTDPLDPPKFKHKKLPVRPPSPPVPIMHSPPRQVTVEDQKNWKIPPCVSNWKNNKGFTLPLHQRLAADGRGLYNHVINDKFAKFSEALLIAERQARKEVEARAQMRLKLSKKQKEQKEKQLAEMAKQAKKTAKYNNYIGIDDKQDNQETHKDKPRDTSVYDANAAKKHAKKQKQKHKSRKRRRDSESESSSDSDSDSDSDEDEREQAREERDTIRRERERERRRQFRLDKKKTGKKQSVRQRERDISERIALGQFSGKKSTDSLYDNRLFNQDSGLNTGFHADDEYNLYDKALFQNKSRKIYRPSVIDEDVYGMDDGDVLNEKSGKIKPHKGFDGAEENRNGRKGGRFEFEKDESGSDSEEEYGKGVVNDKGNDKDELMEELDRFTSGKDRGGDRGKGQGHDKGFMYAAAGGGSIRNKEDYVASNREKVQFHVGDKSGDDGNYGGRKSGLYDTEEMKKRREKKRNDDRHKRYDRDDRRGYDKYDRRDRDRRRRDRSRSRDRSDSRDRDSGRGYRNDRDKRKRNSNDGYNDRGRWGD